jgi:hypothetical protein
MKEAMTAFLEYIRDRIGDLRSATTVLTLISNTISIVGSKYSYYTLLTLGRYIRMGILSHKQTMEALSGTFQIVCLLL